MGSGLGLGLGLVGVHVSDARLPRMLKVLGAPGARRGVEPVPVLGPDVNRHVIDVFAAVVLVRVRGRGRGRGSRSRRVGARVRVRVRVRIGGSG